MTRPPAAVMEQKKYWENRGKGAWLAVTDEQNAVILAEIARDTVTTLRPVLEDKWNSVSEESDLKELQEMTDSFERCQTYSMEAIVEMLANDNAGIPTRSFASGPNMKELIRQYISSPCSQGKAEQPPSFRTEATTSLSL